MQCIVARAFGGRLPLPAFPLDDLPLCTIGFGVISLGLRPKGVRLVTSFTRVSHTFRYPSWLESFLRGGAIGV